jgi:hypothetical protein
VSQHPREVVAKNITPADMAEHANPVMGLRRDHLYETGTVAQVSALIEQSKREVERSRVLLKDERGSASGAPAPV